MTPHLEFEQESVIEKAPLPERDAVLRILVVDDNMPAADSLAKLLNMIGMRAESRYSGAEVLATDTLHDYDVMLLDIGMPEMDGYDLVRRLRERGITCPIVALTGYGLAEDKEKALDAGFSAHLTKPVGLKELRAMLEALTS